MDHLDATQTAEGFWEGRYAERPLIWSGRANAVLVQEAAPLPPGRALDLGCGEGGDALWLAERGWRVTAVDVSATAIARARRTGADMGLAADAVDWVVADLAGWAPTGEYELVTASFLQSPVELPRDDILRRAAQSVVPGGRLLITSHGEAPPWSAHRHEHHPFPTAREQVEALRLPRGQWQELAVEHRPREAVGPEGQTALLVDTVVLLGRR